MALVTSVDVNQIYPMKGVDFAPFIDAADTLINDQLSGSGLSAAMLCKIELYLAAHFAVLSLERGGIQRQHIGDGEDWYQPLSQGATGLETTRFGKQALVFDTSGTLAALSKNPMKAEFRVVSRVPKGCL